MFDYRETKDLVGQMLKMDASEIKDHDNLIELGINSLKIMRLVNEWRKKGAKVTFAQLISTPTFQQWWQYISASNTSEKTNPLKLPLPEGDHGGEFSLTDVQYAYWVGRKKGQVLGDIGCHAYLEIEGQDVDVPQMNSAWKKLIDYHPALRTRFTEVGTQEVLSQTAYGEISIKDLSQANERQVEEGLAEIRNKLSHRKIAVEEGENAGLTLTLLPNKKVRMHFDVDLLAADVQSFQTLLRDLAILYQGKELSVNKKWDFKGYLDLVEKQTSKSLDEAEQYWLNKIEDMPLGPMLPLKKSPKDLEKTVFVAHKASFSKKQWQRLKDKASQYQITPAMVFLTIYCEILERWSQNSRFLINLPIFNRHTEYEGIEDVVADFSNILVMDVDLKEKKTFVERAKAIQASFHSDIQHADYSGIQVTREIAKRYPEAESIAPIVFACNLGEPLLDDNFRQTFGDLEYMVSQTPQVWIDFQMFDYDDGLYIRWDAVEELFPEGMMADMFAACCDWINLLSDEASDWQSVLSVPLIEEKTDKRDGRLNLEMENTMTSLIDGFYDYARNYPDNLAIIQSDSGQTLTYKELAEESLKLAGHLKASGVRAGDVVAISTTRGLEEVMGILAILAVGGVYTPIAPSQPKERRVSMYESSNAQYLLSNHLHGPDIHGVGQVKTLYLEDRHEAIALEESQGLSGDAPAYIIFTSGSSGQPKGVEISHLGAMNTIEAINKKCQIGETDVMLAVSSLEFDLSVYDVFGALNSGAHVVCIPAEHRRNADNWVSLLEKYQVTIWNSVPILFDMLLVSGDSANKIFDHLKWVFLSGDWIGLSLAERMEKQAPNAKMLAMGGATEASIWSNFYDVTLPLDKNWPSIPYGYPLSNQKFAVMDDKWRPCGDWVPGELWIGGKGLALSYVGEEALTAQKFVTHMGQRWYRTGDLGRYWPDGKIEFLGRKDYQVKVRGHRIELGEIENALLTYPEVDTAIVVAKDMPTGQKELLAFIISKEIIETDYLRDHLKSKVPYYMVPDHYVYLEEVPLNQNGKVDRKVLLQWEIAYEDETDKNHQEAVTQTEKKLLEIWKSLLKKEAISLSDSYFKLGGDSLIAAQLSAQIRKTFNVKFMLEHVFQEPILGDQARLLEDMIQADINTEKQEDSPLELPAIQMDRVGRYEAFPLTEIQKAYWIGRKGIYDLGQVSTHYYFEIENRGFDIEKFKKAFHAFLMSHDMMRATISSNGEEQMVLEDIPAYTLREYHLQDMDENALNREVAKIRAELSHKIFEPESWPLFDIRMSLLPDNVVRLHFCFDNIIFDGWSIFYFFNEMNKMYNKDHYPVNEPLITFRDYVLAVEKLKTTPAFEVDRDYWMKRLASLPPAPELPVQEATSHTFNHLEYRLDKRKWTHIKNRLKTIGGITPSVFLMTAYAEILATWSKKQKFTLNLTRFNRMPIHPNINEVVGDFTSLTLLEIDMTSKMKLSFIDQCQKIQTQLLKDLEHPLFCGVQVQRELGKLHQNSQGVLMPVVFTSALGLQVNQTEEKNWFENRIYSSSETPQVWLDHQATEEDGGLVLIWDYIKELYPEGMIDEMFKAYTGLINRLYQEADAWQDQGHKLMSNSRIEAFEKKNLERIDYPDESLVSLFDKQWQETPNNIAIIHKDKQMTYKELALKVDRLAVEVKSLNKDETPLIAILMEKGMEQVIASLGIMKAGYAYLPLDIHHPRERIMTLLEKAGVNIVLSQSWIEKEALIGKSYLDIDSLSDEGTEGLVFDTINPENIAYVIYTSGSTGEPKGVTITHKSAVNTILDVNSRFDLRQEDRSIALSNLNFDLSVYDIFGLLAVGGAIVIPDDKELKNPKHWIHLLEHHKVSVWNTVPTFMNMLTEFMGDRDIDASLRLIMLSGDWIPLGLPDQVKKLFPTAMFVSLGGATEAAIWSNYYRVNHVSPEWKSIPYGVPLANQGLYIYNERLQACPCGVCGDLYIGGKGVALGYWKDKERTDAQFIEHPITRERLYKTGDLAAYMPDGNIEFLGREDNQVKIRGFRIGLGEIESAIRQHPQIRESVTLVDERDQKQLLSFVIPEKVANPYTHDGLLMDAQPPIQSIYEDMALEKNKKSTQDILHKMDNLSVCAAADILRHMGLIKDQTEGLNLSDSLNQMDFDYRYRPLIDHWIGALKEVGALTQTREDRDYYDYHPSLKEWSIERKKDSNLVLDMVDMSNYYEETRATYLEVLKGKKAVNALFMEDSFLDASKKLTYYQEINQHYYDVVAHLIERYIDANEETDILELGSRFGSMTERISKCEGWKDWSYVYTDSSNYFIKEKEKDYKDMTFEVFDFDKNPSGQGVAGKKFNLILADNSLHRAKNIHGSLGHIKSLLKENGLLIFIENTKLNCFDLNVAGLYEYGFSNYSDLRQERKQPFLQKNEWLQVLEDSGMDLVDSFGGPENLSNIYGRCLYVVKAKETPKAIDTEELTTFLSDRLPAYMVPNAFTMLDVFPMTANGKIDRKSLLSHVEYNQTGLKKMVNPENEAEFFVQALWKDLLQVEDISVEDNFFEIGGDSLLAIQCMNRLTKELMVDVSLQDIFSADSLRALAKTLLEKGALNEDIDQGEI
jgi:yersiniabactin nonribosomal peptide synthetase